MNGFLKSKPMQKLVNFKKSSWNCKRLIILQKFYINFFFFLVKKFGGWIWWSWNLHLWQWGSSKLLLASIAVSWNSDLRRKWRKNLFSEILGVSRCHICWLQSMSGKPVGCCKVQSAGLKFCTYLLLELWVLAIISLPGQGIFICWC